MSRDNLATDGPFGFLPEGPGRLFSAGVPSVTVPSSLGGGHVTGLRTAWGGFHPYHLGGTGETHPTLCASR